MYSCGLLDIVTHDQGSVSQSHLSEWSSNHGNLLHQRPTDVCPGILPKTTINVYCSI